MFMVYKQAKTYYFLFAQASNNYFTIILVYIYDIIITMNDLKGIKVVKENLHSIFKLREIGKLKYFIIIEMTYFKNEIYLSY